MTFPVNQLPRGSVPLGRVKRDKREADKTENADELSSHLGFCRAY